MTDAENRGRGHDRKSVVPLMLETVNRESTVIEIARQLLSQLLSGQITPGTRLPSERQLAETMGVGRSTIREALKSLDVLGIIDVRQGDGTYLKGSTSELLPQAIEWGLMLGQPHVVDLIEARRYLEDTIARLAAQRADETEIRDLERCFEEMRSANEIPAFVEADVAFHLTLVKAARNAVLADILVSIRSLLMVWIRRAIAQAGETQGTVQDHGLILDAVRRGDQEGAAAAMKAHMEHASRLLYDSLEDDSDT